MTRPSSTDGLVPEDRPSRWARALLRWRWLVLVLTLIVAGVAASGMRFLTFQTNYRIFFSEENPQLRAYDELQATYARTDNLLFALQPAEGSVFDRATLGAIASLTERAWQLPYATRVDSVTNFQHSRAEGDDLVVGSLVPSAGNLSPADLDRVRRIALAEPSLVNRLVSPDGRTAGVNVTIHLPGKSHAETPAVVEEATKLARSLEEEHPGLRVAITGIVAFSNAFRATAAHDVRTLYPIMYGVIVVAMFLLLRSVSAALAVLLVITLATLTAMGLTGWAGESLSSPVAMAPTAILTLAVADGVHILVSMFEAVRRGRSKDDAIVESLRINFQPVFLTSLTTIIGFLTLNFSEAPPYRLFGNVTALGVGVAWLYSIVLLPVLMAVLPLRPAAGRQPRARAMNRLAGFVIARRRVLVGAVGLAVVALGTLVPRLEIDDQFIGFFDPRIPFRADTDFTTENLTGIYQIDYSLGAARPGGVTDPEYLRRVEAFAEWYEAQPGVLHVATLTDVMKRIHRNLHGDDPEEYRLPDDQELAAQSLLLYEMSLPYGLDLNNQVDLDKSATRFQVTVEPMSSSEFRLLRERAERWLRENAPPSMHAEGTGPAVIFTDLNYDNMWSMFLGTPLALLLIGLCLCVSFRSLRMGAISMIPNVTPPIVTFGIWALLVGRAGLAASFVTAVALGIIVDDTVHIVAKYLRARREEGFDPAGAVRYTLATVGPAICFTTGILVAGFCVLTVSAFELNATLGQLTATTITAALVTDLFLLPPLLMMLDRGGTAEP